MGYGGLAALAPRARAAQNPRVLVWSYVAAGSVVALMLALSIFVLRSEASFRARMPHVGAGPGGLIPLPLPPTPTTAEQMAERICFVLIPLARQQLDAVNRKHGAAGTDALAIVALDVAIATGVVTYGVANRYPGNWWASLVLIGLSTLLAAGTRIPIRRRRYLALPGPGAARFARFSATIQAGFAVDEGSDPSELLIRIENTADRDAYELVLAGLIRARGRSAASVRLIEWVLRVALLLLLVDGVLCAVFFL